MKVSPISNNSSKPIQSFKGLWGKTNYESHILDSSYYIYERREIKDYFPFLDESKSEIVSVIKKNTLTTGKGIENLTDVLKQMVSVKNTLNFTKADWADYISGKLKKSFSLKDRSKANLIEENLKSLNLTKYIK